MRGGALPPALLCAVLGLLLAYAPRRAVVPSILAMVVVAVGAFLLPVPERFEEAVFLGCWLSLMVTAACIHLPSGPGARLAVGLSANVGLWAGMVIAMSGQARDLAIALPLVLLVVPAVWLRTTPAELAVKIVASWLGAVAILTSALPLLPTAGYEPDHKE